MKNLKKIFGFFDWDINMFLYYVLVYYNNFLREFYFYLVINVNRYNDYL